jgi:hypothetical protein
MSMLRYAGWMTVAIVACSTAVAQEPGACAASPDVRVRCDGPGIAAAPISIGGSRQHVLIADVVTVRAARAKRATRRGAADAPSTAVTPAAEAPATPVAAKDKVRYPARSPFGPPALRLGMTDDEALNAPSWGRPSNIERERVPQGFRETWTYQRTVYGARQLEFVNGRLMAIGSAVAAGAAQQLATLDLQ